MFFHAAGPDDFLLVILTPQRGASSFTGVASEKCVCILGEVGRRWQAKTDRAVFYKNNNALAFYYGNYDNYCNYSAQAKGVLHGPSDRYPTSRQ